MRASVDWVGVRVVVVAFGAWLLASCGKAATDSSAPPAPEGYSGFGGGASTERAGADGGGAAGASGTLGAGASGMVLSGDSTTEACIAYVLAQCLRRTECLGNLATVEACMLATSACPDSVFSDGSTRSASSTQACAAEYTTFPCDKLNAGFLPDCATPGTRTAGQMCAYNAQCGSLSCDLRVGECGRCSSLGELGADCSMLGLDCKAGLDCDRTAGHCVAHVERLLEGSPCVGVDACRYGLLCTKGVCAKTPTLGMSCADTGQCTKGSYCTGGGRICTAPPGPGKACGTDASGANICSGAAYCSNADPAQITCSALPTSGQPCASGRTADMSVIVEACTEGLYCNLSSLCVPPDPRGASCQGDGQCQVGLTCACSNASCSERSCATLSLRDQPCDVPGATCHPGFSCVAGQCQPSASQGLFAAKCAGT